MDLEVLEESKGTGRGRRQDLRKYIDRMFEDNGQDS